jgi:hypothetical protein
MLCKGRRLYDDQQTLSALPRGITRSITQRRRLDMTPTYLKKRVADSQDVPDVQASGLIRGHVSIAFSECGKITQCL